MFVGVGSWGKDFNQCFIFIVGTISSNTKRRPELHHAKTYLQFLSLSLAYQKKA